MKSDLPWSCTETSFNLSQELHSWLQNQIHPTSCHVRGALSPWQRMWFDSACPPCSFFWWQFCRAFDENQTFSCLAYSSSKANNKRSEHSNPPQCRYALYAFPSTSQGEFIPVGQMLQKSCLPIELMADSLTVFCQSPILPIGNNLINPAAGSKVVLVRWNYTSQWSELHTTEFFFFVFCMHTPQSFAASYNQNRSGFALLDDFGLKNKILWSADTSSFHCF